MSGLVILLIVLTCPIIKYVLKSYRLWRLKRSLKWLHNFLHIATRLNSHDYKVVYLAVNLGDLKDVIETLTGAHKRGHRTKSNMASKVIETIYYLDLIRDQFCEHYDKTHAVVFSDLRYLMSYHVKDLRTLP